MDYSVRNTPVSQLLVSTRFMNAPFTIASPQFGNAMAIQTLKMVRTGNAIMIVVMTVNKTAHFIRSVGAIFDPIADHFQSDTFVVRVAFKNLIGVQSTKDWGVGRSGEMSPKRALFEAQQIFPNLMPCTLFVPNKMPRRTHRTRSA